MMTNDYLINLDLDFHNLIKDFPENEIDSYIFLRSHLTEMENIGLVHAKGTNEGFHNCLIAFIEDSEENEALFINTLLTYVANDKYKIETLITILKGLL